MSIIALIFIDCYDHMKSLIIVALVVCGGICACGQKGELYLPDSTATVDVSEYERQDSQGNQEQNY